MVRPKRAFWRARAALWAALWAALGGAWSCAAAQAQPVPATDALDHHEGYQLGHGLPLADTGLTLGGYSTLSYSRRQGQTPEAGLDNLSLFVWWEGQGRWKLFSELDYEHPWTSRAPDTSDEHHYLALERLYLDYALADSATVRLGKFLTPIGRWNLVHATPLVWTTSRPLVTAHTFPTNVTGVMLSGVVPDAGAGLEYAVYASNGVEWRPSPELDTFHRAIGGHVSWPLWPGGRLGLSYAAFEQERTRGEHKQLAGLDYVWTYRDFELSAEAVYRVSDAGPAWDEKGAFVQFVAPLSHRLYAVVRGEGFRQAGVAGATQLWVAGLNYRITPALVLKAEWVGSQHKDTRAPTGLLSSLSVLF